MLVDNDEIESVQFTGGSATVLATTVDGEEFRSVLPPGFTDEFTDILLATSPAVQVSTVQPPPGGTDWPLLLRTVLPLVLMIVLVWVILARMSGGKRAGKKFTANTRKEGSELQDVTFADVAGASEAVVELGEIREFLSDPKRFQDMGAKIPKGVLLLSLIHISEPTRPY